MRALRRDLATSAGLASFIPPVDAPAVEIETERATIAARRAEEMAKRATLEQQIAGKEAEAGENAATIAKL